jgi:drug/metabolite transporter (DMT)-like permease
LPKPCDESIAGGAACRRRGVAFAVDAVALVILFFDPAGDFWKEMAAHWPAVKQRWRYVALVGWLGLAGFTSLFSLGAQHTTAVNLGITQGAIPAFVVLFGMLVLGTPVGKLQFFGLLLSL